MGMVLAGEGGGGERGYPLARVEGRSFMHTVKWTRHGEVVE